MGVAGLGWPGALSWGRQDVTTNTRHFSGLYYNNSPVQANFASLPTLLNHFGTNSPAPSLVQTATSMNFGNNGSGFPSPYHGGASNFEAFYSGKVNIATAGTYTFNTSSDDGSMLFIDGQVVVTNNFDQPVTMKSGSIALTAGMHDIVIAFNQGGGGYGMNAQISGADDVNMVDINTSNTSNASITPDLVVGSLAGGGNVVLTTGNLITGTDNSSTSFAGTISGIGSVMKFGTGVQTLTGTLSYGGSTSVQGGTLAVVGSLPAASTDYETWGAPYGLATASEGGDLDNDGITNFEEYAFGLIPNSGASVTYADGGLNGQTGGTGLSNAWASTTNVSGGVATGNDGSTREFIGNTFGSTGTLWLSFDWGNSIKPSKGGSFGGLTFFIGGSEKFLIGTTMLDVDAIPEPSAALLGGLGMLALLRRRR